MNTVKNDRGEDCQVDEDGFLEGVNVSVDLSDLIDGNLESFLDLISERAGFPLLTEQSYAIVGFTGETTLTLRVTGNVEMELDSRNDS